METLMKKIILYCFLKSIQQAFEWAARKKLNIFAVISALCVPNEKNALPNWLYATSKQLTIFWEIASITWDDFYDLDLAIKYLQYKQSFHI